MNYRNTVPTFLLAAISGFTVATVSIKAGEISISTTPPTPDGDDVWNYAAPTATQKWFDLYPDDDSVLPKILDNDRADTPRFSWYLHWNLPEPRLKWVKENNQWRNLVRSYLACTSFVDAQIGRLLVALDESGVADNTIVVVWGDHGWHLGEKEITGKNTLWDRGTKVPLIFVCAGVKGGQRVLQPAELLDIYPTLIDLAHLPARTDLEGLSLAPQLKNAAAPRLRPAITSHNQGNHGIRSERWRYIRNFMPGQTWMAWHRYKDACYPVVPLMRKLFSEGKLTGPPLALMASAMPAEELYDTEADPHEINNLAESPDPAHQKIRAELRQRLEAWIEETRDQGRTPEDPRVEAYMQKQMHELFGTPGYYPASWQPQLIK